MNATETTQSAGERCGCCGRVFPVLVDDTELCISCDSLHFPNWSAA